MRRILIPLIFGLAGAAVLISLGVWQMQRLEWKQNVLAEIETRIHARPVALPAAPDPVVDRFLPVTVSGAIQPGAIRVLVSQRKIGAGYRLINRMVLTDGRVILVDRGFVQLEQEPPAGDYPAVTVTGNLHWPEERDGYTPENDLKANIWFAREVPVLAQALGTEPVLVIARNMSVDDAPVSPLPVGAEGIPNDHLEYAVTWFGLAAVWLAMLGLFLWRIVQSVRNPAKGTET
ncbi:SURF1 family protein [Thalassovita taeanensis]|uniref:SURF1-like protein n=1 Tax=Thalassovita taeanensis TaxID=657014 RepID=A0A1H9AA23_9RHOB|nr:SURF1 family protein [Thalassovita taeanensis]SEP73283.1 surfeit locus 1 family protein [Thalassovita taeanensis]